MTARTTPPAAPARAAVAYRLTFGRTLRSEVIKLLTLRSTWWALGVAVGLSVALPVIVVLSSIGSDMPPSGYSLVNMGLVFVHLVLPIFGVLTITGEFSTGSIRSTLTAQPSRAMVVGAKVTVLAGAATVVSVLTYALGLGVTLPFSDGLDWSTPEISTAPLCAGVLSTVVFALLGFGLGLIIRNTGGAISATMAVLYVLPAALNVVWALMSGGDPSSGVFNFADLLPTQAGSLLADPSKYAPLGPLLVLGAWALVPALVGGALLRRRDG